MTEAKGHILDVASKFHYLDALLEKQKAAFLKTPMPAADQRIKNLDLLHNALINYKDRLILSISNDFGNRSESETLLAEVIPLLEGIAYNRKRLKKWMRPQKRHVPLTLLPASVSVLYQPLGVVGIVVPWNFPLFLGLSPLIGALSAGNRAIIKTSEFAPQTSAVIKEMLETIFLEEEVAVVEGDVDVSQAFTKLPFDHLLFTGAVPVGRMVMKAAAENLTPVTLELGGKSPAIIHKDFPMNEAAKRLVFGKCFNAGQICVSPDYILCQRDRVNEFADEFSKAVSNSYPTMKTNDDYTSIINDRQHQRLQDYLRDAEEKGARLVTINPAGESFEGSGKMPVTMVLNCTEDMLVVKEEIFGPILPILPYDEVDTAIEYVNSRPRPLALYYFDWDKKRADNVLKRTHSGGVCVNDTLSHVGADDIPFGGVGDSGMGHYHGKEGFLTFSKAKGIVRKGKLNVTEYVAPPWGNGMYKLLMQFMWLRFRKKKV